MRQATEAMRRNCSVDEYEKELRDRIIELRLFYDLLALELVCQNAKRSRLLLNGVADEVTFVRICTRSMWSM
jgi:hypothetical protein